MRNCHRNRATSFSSVTTNSDCDTSLATVPVSNTFRSKQRKQRKQRHFLAVKNVLLDTLATHDPVMFQTAQEVVKRHDQARYNDINNDDDNNNGNHNNHNNHNNHKHNDKDSLIGSDIYVFESCKEALKQVVDTSYWTQAKSRIQELENDVNEPIPIGSEDTIADISNENLKALSSSLGVVETMRDFIKEEQEKRRSRFWRLMRILLECTDRIDSARYSLALKAMEECAKRKERGEEGYTNLVVCVQREVKKIVGTDIWRQAERILSKELVKEIREKEHYSTVLDAKTLATIFNGMGEQQEEAEDEEMIHKNHTLHDRKSNEVVSMQNTNSCCGGSGGSGSGGSSSHSHNSPPSQRERMNKQSRVDGTRKRKRSNAGQHCKGCENPPTAIKKSSDSCKYFLRSTRRKKQQQQQQVTITTMQ